MRRTAARRLIPGRTAGRLALASFLVLLGMTACSTVTPDPYYALTLEEAQGKTRLVLPNLNVCYNAAAHTAEQVRQLVRENCEGAVLVENVRDLDTCSVAAPIRVTYHCAKLSRAVAEQRPMMPLNNHNSGKLNF